MLGQSASRDARSNPVGPAKVPREAPVLSAATDILGDVTPIRRRANRRSPIVYSERSPLALAQRAFDPTLAAVLLPATCGFFGQAFTRPYQLMAACAFLAALSAFRMAGLYRWDGGRSRLTTITRVAGAWACVAALLAALGHSTGLLQEMSAGVLVAWGLGVPASIILMHGAAAAGMRALRARGLAGRTAVVVGAGPTGREFAQRVQDEPACGIRLVGFFDDRRPSGGTTGLPLLEAHSLISQTT